MKRERKQKIGIVGAGSVGATIAYACMVRGIGKHISLFDVAKPKLQTDVLDLNHGLMFVPEAQLDGAADIEVLKGADTVVITAGAKQEPGQTRFDLARPIRRFAAGFSLKSFESLRMRSCLWSRIPSMC